VDARHEAGHDGKTRFCVVLFLLALACLIQPTSARADLKICNRMSYVVEAAIGIDDRGATATRGWFRIDPAQCRTVLQGQVAADRLLLHARALSVYGASPAARDGADMLCVADANFTIAAARQCRDGQSAVPFTEVKPSSDDAGNSVAYLSEDSEYDDEQARLAGIQRLLTIAGYDATPIDGVDGRKTQTALAAFLASRNLAADAVQGPAFFETLLGAAQSPSSRGLTWCNDTPHRIMAAVATDDGKVQTSRGWYRIEPNTCLHPDIAGQPKRVFSFAEAVDADGHPVQLAGRPLNWSGPSIFCTQDVKFELSEQGDCSARGLAATGFAAVDLGSGGKTLRFAVP
jgi:uncharacterized membrane protein